MMTPSGDIHEHRPMDREIFSVITKLNTEEDINLVAPSESDKVLSGISPTLFPTAFTIAAIKLSNTHSILSSLTSKQRPFTSANDLASNWRIGKEVANNTLQATTQRGIRIMLNPTLERRYNSNDKMLRYNRLDNNLYTDTLFSSVKSTLQNKCAQLYCSNLDWTRFYPMTARTCMHEIVAHLFRNEGIPKHLILDGAKEQVSEEVRNKFSDANCGLKQPEFDILWVNRVKLGIRELKKGSCRKMMDACSPLQLWDYCGELEACVMSNTAHRSLLLDGQVPETLVLGKISDILYITEFG